MKKFIVCLAAFSTTFSTAQAQQFELEPISPVTDSVNERAIDLTDNGFVLGISNGCPFVYNRKDASHIELCNQGLGDAYDINKKMQVVGIVAGLDYDHRHAAIWDRAHGTRDLGVLNQGDTFSAALGINDLGQVVGFSGYKQEVEEDGYTRVSYHSKAFLWDKKKGMRSLFKFEESAALKINNRGTIIAQVSNEFSTDYWAETHFVIKYPSRKALKLTRNRSAECYDYSYGSPEENVPNVDINEKGQFVVARCLYDAKTRRGDNVASAIPASRSDFGYGTNLNDQAKVVGNSNGAGYFYKAGHNAVITNCLFQQNEKLRSNEISTFADLYVSDAAAINNKNEILITADIANDGKGDRLFIVKEKSEKEKGPYYSFCPTLKAEIVGECAPYFVKDPYSDWINQQKEIPSGKECALKVRVLDDNKAAAAIRVALESVGFCEDPQFQTSVTGVGGAATQIVFNYETDKSYTLTGAYSDPRFIQPTLRIDSGEFSTNPEDVAYRNGTEPPICK